MKTYIIVTFIIVSSLFAKAQSYVPLLSSGQKWEQFEDDIINGPGICGWIYGKVVSISRDTIISGVTYKILQANPIEAPVYPYPIYCPPYVVNDSISYDLSIVREDTIAKKVFILGQNTEYLLYDFSALPGDTLLNYYQSVFPALPTVDSVSIINYPIIGLRKTYYINCHDGVSTSANATYIEGIGGYQGVNYTLYDYFESNASLTCVRDSNGIPVYGNCLSSSVGLNENSKEQLRFNYNHNSREFILNSAGNQFYSISFFNLLGQLVLEKSELTTNQKYFLDFPLNEILLYRIKVVQSASILTGKIR